MLQQLARYSLANRRDAHELSDPHGLLVAFPLGFGLKTRWYARGAAPKLIDELRDDQRALLDARCADQVRTGP